MSSLYPSSERHVSPCRMTWWLFLSMHVTTGSHSGLGFGDLHSLWYVVREEAMEIVILKCCSDVFSLLYNVSNYNTASKIHRGVCVLRLTNVHIFHIFTFTVCDISVGMWDHVSSWPGCRSGKCHILSAPLWLICSLLWLHGQNGAKVNLLDLCVSLVVLY